jgi:CPA1 family monovalent cation:H+ antiporter
MLMRDQRIGHPAGRRLLYAPGGVTAGGSGDPGCSEAAMTEAGVLGIELFVALLATAVAVALVTRRLSIPYSVALVVAGLAISFVGPLQRVEIGSDLILAVLIPGLVFEAAYKIHLDELRRTFPAVAVLAVPGVAVTAAVVAAIVSSATGLDTGLAFLLGAIVCATDPVAVIAIFRQLRAPTRLATVVEAESLLNDGTGVVLFTIALAAISRPIGLIEAIGTFAFAVVASTLLGTVAGFVAVRVMRLADDPLVEVMASVVAAYGTYLVAEHWHQSGIIATVVAGIVIGNPGVRWALGARTTEALDLAWETIAFLLTTLTFLLVGVVITPATLLAAIPVIVAGYVAITVARALVVYGVIGGGQRLFPARFGHRLPVGYLHVMFWAGLRGAIAVALVLALPADLPSHDLVAGGVYGIVLITLLVQGTTAGWVVRRAGVPTGGAATAP